jgi:hypothetical protein
MFLTLGLIVVVAIPPGIFVIRKYGPQWRRDRMEKLASEALPSPSEKAAGDAIK